MKSAAVLLLMLLSVPPLSAGQASVASLAGTPQAEILQFSVAPAQIPSGEPALFSFGLEGTGDSIFNYNATITIHDQAGTEVSRLQFLEAALAGGETQELSKQWESQNILPGRYFARLNVTFSNGEARQLEAGFEIILRQESGAAAGQEKQSEPPLQSCGSLICGPPGNCYDNYTTSQCSFSACPETPVFKVAFCGDRSELPGPGLQNEICASFPSLCSSQASANRLLEFCFPGIIALAALVFLSLRKIRRMQ